MTRAQASIQRRELIVHSALACFIEKGFHKTSVRDIAAKAKISLGNVYNHFPSKEALIFEIADLESKDVERYESLLRDDTAPKETMVLFIESYLTEVADPAYAIVSIEITAEALRNPRVAEVFEKNRKRMMVGIKNLLRAGMKQGVFDPSLNPLETAEILIDLIESTGFRLAMSPKKTGRKVGKKAKKSLVAPILKILLAPL